MLNAFSGLEELYIHGSGREPMTSEIIQAALPSKDTLRVLKVDLGSGRGSDELSSFPVLEKLLVYQIFFYPGDSWRSADADELRFWSLVNMIPASLRELTLLISSTHVFSNIRVLAEEMSRGRFPHLRHIRIEGSSGRALQWNRDNDDDYGGFLRFFDQEKEKTDDWQRLFNPRRGRRIHTWVDDI
ncbi:hypothetical protein E4U55_006576 [Claviceps digitariae]|nr:hypothetical protein E4U55_006576 [Claviceps digitariae]